MTHFNWKAIFLLSGSALILSACGNDPKVANEANFEQALNVHFAKIKQCVGIGGEPNDEGIIQEFRIDGSIQDKNLPFYNGLVSLGLLETISYQKDVKTFSGQVTGKAEWVGFKFSGLGSTYLRPTDLDKGAFSTGTLQLCFGTPQVVEVTNFTEPSEVMGLKSSNVRYTYKLVDIAPWANDPILSTQFKWLSKRLSNQSISKDDDMVLTNNGWVHHSAVK